MGSSLIVTLTGVQDNVPSGVSFAAYDVVLTDPAGVVQTHHVDTRLGVTSRFDDVADGSTTSIVITPKDTAGNPLPAPFEVITIPPFVTPIPPVGGTILRVTGATVSAV